MAWVPIEPVDPRTTTLRCSFTGPFSQPDSTVPE
jgi:hypothetical protein